VIVSRGTMAERFVRHLQTGVMAERDDALASASLIAQLMANQTLLKGMGSAARDELRARRGLSATADAIMKVLREASTAQVAA
jgi:hypothetical protein